MSEGGHADLGADAVCSGPELRLFFQELHDGGGGDAKVDGDRGGVAAQGVEEVEDEAKCRGEERMSVGDFDAGLVAEGEEPIGRLKVREVDGLAQVSGELEAQAA